MEGGIGDIFSFRVFLIFLQPTHIFLCVGKTVTAEGALFQPQHTQGTAAQETRPWEDDGPWGAETVGAGKKAGMRTEDYLPSGPLGACAGQRGHLFWAPWGE